MIKLTVKKNKKKQEQMYSSKIVCKIISIAYYPVKSWSKNFTVLNKLFTV